MAAPSDDKSLALYCDFENIALGVRDAKYQKFDIHHILERLLVKGSIVVKKAYCDWDRYKNFKGAMHEAAFELIEIPHVRMSGKNSADIRMVVDALDLCYTKSHVDTFVIISGDSDFSPLVSKLRENAKTVIGVGVKNSTSDLLIASCDEFIYYDDLVRELERKRAPTRKKRASKKRASRAKDGPEDAKVVSIEEAAKAAAANDGGAAVAVPGNEVADGELAAAAATEGSEANDDERPSGESAAKKTATKRRAARKRSGAAGGTADGDGDGDGSTKETAEDAAGAEAAETENGEGAEGSKGASRSRRGARRSRGASAQSGETVEHAAAEGSVAETSAADATDADATDADVDAVATPEDDGTPEELAQEGLDVIIETALALSTERGGADKLWGSMVKQTLKRRRPGFNESYYGFDSFGGMLEEAAARGYLALEHDDRSGGYIITKITA